MDGLHQEDLANYVLEFPNSNIAALANTGVTYQVFIGFLCCAVLIRINIMMWRTLPGMQREI